LNIHFNIILPCTSSSSKWSLVVRSPHSNPVCTSPVLSTCYTPRPSNSYQFDHQNSKAWWRIPCCH
jgi:hypothetical protein